MPTCAERKAWELATYGLEQACQRGLRPCLDHSYQPGLARTGCAAAVESVEFRGDLLPPASWPAVPLPGLSNPAASPKGARSLPALHPLLHRPEPPGERARRSLSLAGEPQRPTRDIHHA